MLYPTKGSAKDSESFKYTCRNIRPAFEAGLFVDIKQTVNALQSYVLKESILQKYEAERKAFELEQQRRLFTDRIKRDRQVQGSDYDSDEEARERLRLISEASEDEEEDSQTDSWDYETTDNEDYSEPTSRLQRSKKSLKVLSSTRSPPPPGLEKSDSTGTIAELKRNLLTKVNTTDSEGPQSIFASGMDGVMESSITSKLKQRGRDLPLPFNPVRFIAQILKDKADKRKEEQRIIDAKKRE